MSVQQPTAIIGSAPDLVYLSLVHVEQHVSGGVVDGLVDELQGQRVAAQLVVVLGEQEQGPQVGAGGLPRPPTAGGEALAGAEGVPVTVQHRLQAPHLHRTGNRSKIIDDLSL